MNMITEISKCVINTVGWLFEDHQQSVQRTSIFTTIPFVDSLTVSLPLWRLIFVFSEEWRRYSVLAQPPLSLHSPSVCGMTTVSWIENWAAKSTRTAASRDPALAVKRMFQWSRVRLVRSPIRTERMRAIESAVSSDNETMERLIDKI